jgi:hypothetical protein
MGNVIFLLEKGVRGNGTDISIKIVAMSLLK